ncbi:hypothetical protein GmHk_11G031091 [Glycine max]|nr:hypothetical protein GmHk_11G031091 [Glycine max]
MWFVSLKLISDVSTVHCGHHEYMDVSPVLAYIALALQMTVDNVDRSSIQNGDTKRKKTKIDSSTLLSENILELTIEHVLNCLEKLFGADDIMKNHDADSCKLQPTNRTNENQNFTRRRRLSPTDACRPSNRAKILNVILTDSCESSITLPKAFALANNLLDLIISIESCMRSGYAVRIVAAAKTWLPDVLLALGSTSILKHTDCGEEHSTASEQMKLHFPKWPLILAKTELFEVNKAEDDESSQPEKFSAFTKLMEMLIILLKKIPSIMDAVGVIFMVSSVIGLEQKDFGMALGLLWIEREIAEENDDELEKLTYAKELIEPLWMYHLYETGRVSLADD